MPAFSSLFVRDARLGAAASGFPRQGDASHPQADPLTPPLGRRPAIAVANEKGNTFMSALAALALFIPLSGAIAADQRSNLTPGIYQAGPNGCSHPTSAGTMTFDGTNFSGNHQFCKTIPLDQQFRYRLTCIDLMGDKSPADFDTDPNKEDFDLTIRVVDSHKFSIDGQRYEFCGGLK